MVLWRTFAACIACLAFGGVAGESQAAGAVGDKNPVSRVVEMLQELGSEISENIEIEQKLFDKYGCWYVTVMAAKKASNSEAADRNEALASYIDDIQSGRIEFSSEGAEATQDVQELRQELEQMSARRQKEKDDYDAAHEEMTDAIGALEEALEELENGSGGAAFLSTGRALTRPGMHRAAELAQTLLSQKDAALIVKTAEMGAASSQKRKDTKKIRDLIEEMLQTFKDNRAQAEEKEKTSEASYGKLKTSKDDQLESSENALASLGGETASREEAVAEAKKEVAGLEEQVTKDKDFMADITSQHDDDKESWKERKKLMTLEAAAISQAIAILQSDKARDAMSKSFDKDRVFNPSLLQVAAAPDSNSTNVHENATGSVHSAKAKLHSAADALDGQAKSYVVSAHKHTSHRLKKLAHELRKKAREPEGEGGGFSGIVNVLNDAKRDMNEEAAQDARKKTTCEESLTKKTGEAQVSSNFVDEKTRYINRTSHEVADLYAVVNKTVDEIVELEWELNDATLDRQEVHEAFEKERGSLKAAIGVVKLAKTALAKFYEENGLSLVQRRVSGQRASAAMRTTSSERELATARAVSAERRLISGNHQDIIVEAGEAPPPPPPIVTKAYEGNSASGGIQGVLGEIKDDIEADVGKLEATEAKHVSAYDDVKSKLLGLISEKMEYKETKEGEISEKLGDISDANTAKVGEKDELDSTVASLKELEPDCNYVLTTEGTRMRNRIMEAQSVNEAIKSLGGDAKQVELEQ